CRNLAAHGGLAEIENFARMGEAPGLGDRVKYAQLVPIHRCRPRSGASSLLPAWFPRSEPRLKLLIRGRKSVRDRARVIRSPCPRCAATDRGGTHVRPCPHSTPSLRAANPAAR